MLLTGETQDGSPVEFEDLPTNGVYNVVVFPLTENGIVGTTVAFTEQVTVTVVPTVVPTVATTVVSLSPDTTDASVTLSSISTMTSMAPVVMLASFTLTLTLHVHIF